MTDNIDQTNQPGSQSQHVSRTVLHDIDEFLEDGLLVFDVNGERVGGVKAHSTAAGYLLVGTGVIGERDLYIPFRLIRSIDPQEIALSESNYALDAGYAKPPASHTIVENRFVPGPHRDTLPQAYEVRVVQSGYDDEQTIVDSVELGGIAERLSVGLAVYDADGVRLGDITQYDVSRGLLTVEKGIFKPTVLLVPFSAIKEIDEDALSVSLTLPRAALMKEQTQLPTES
jgi:ribosomal 30S subunit maturation factor RimM